MRRDEHQLGGLQRFGNCQGDAVGVDAVSLALAVEAQRGQDGHDAVVEQLLKHLHVHPLDLAGEELVHAMQDADGVGDDGIGAGGAEVNRREALQDFVRQPVGGGQGELERGFDR